MPLISFKAILSNLKQQLSYFCSFAKHHLLINSVSYGFQRLGLPLRLIPYSIMYPLQVVWSFEHHSCHFNFLLTTITIYIPTPLSCFDAYGHPTRSMVLLPALVNITAHLKHGLSTSNDAFDHQIKMYPKFMLQWQNWNNNQL